MDEILMLQDEISALQACFSRELQMDEDSLEADAGDQLALQSTLTVLGERMATIHMKASGKRQLLEVSRSNIMQSNGDGKKSALSVKKDCSRLFWLFYALLFSTCLSF